MVHTGYINQTQLANEIAAVIPKLGDAVVRLRHSVGPDTGGDPAVYFRIVLSDAAASEDTRQDVRHRIMNILIEEIRPREDWGLIPYFSFRGNSEKTGRYEPEWA